MDFKDYYASLGVAKTASAKDIKQAYRRLARKHHPDVNPGDAEAETRFKEINEAYEVLGDPEKRRKYDELGANWRAYEQAERAGAGGAGPFGGGWTVETGGPAGGYRTMTEEEMRELFGGEDPFSDFFHTFFGFGGGATPRGRQTRTQPHRGRDLEQALELTLEEAFRGAPRRLAIKHGGHARTVDVRIPAGVGDGARVRIAGEGARGTQGAPAGDLFLRIRIPPHAHFERRGQDLYATVGIPVTTAVLGGEASVAALDGQSLRVKIPALTQAGQTLRLKGHGMPKVGQPETRGDLYVRVAIQIPTRLSPEAQAHYEALAALEGHPSHSAA